MSNAFSLINFSLFIPSVAKAYVINKRVIVCTARVAFEWAINRTKVLLAPAGDCIAINLKGSGLYVVLPGGCKL